MQILIWHEIVNDRLSETPIAVTFCPLCNASIVFERRVAGGEVDFGTTGKLRHSDLVITSYSIHYTKLYELAVEAAARNSISEGLQAIAGLNL